MTSKALNKTAPTSLANAQKEMAAKLAELAASATTSNSNSLKFGPGTVTFPDVGEAKAPVDVVIVDTVTRREFYDKPIDLSGNSKASVPACFAVGRGDAAAFKPVDGAPNKQADACKGCPQNEWGTSKTGKGKACGEYRHVAVMLATAKNEGDPIYTARITPSKLKDFDTFTRNVMTRTGKLPLFFISQLNTAPVGSSFSCEFNLKDENPTPEYFWSRTNDAADILNQVPDFSGYTK